MKRDLWVCERKETSNGTPIFKPISKVSKEKIKQPNIITIEKGDLAEFNETLEILIEDGFDLIDIVHKHQDEFFSSYQATLINLDGGKPYGIRGGHISSTNSAIH